jgi:hypothetical protein
MKRQILGAVAGSTILISAFNSADILPTRFAKEHATVALSNLLGCINGSIPIIIEKVRDSEDHTAFSAKCGGNLLFLAMKDRRIVPDWDATRSHTELVINQSYVEPGDGKEVAGDAIFGIIGGFAGFVIADTLKKRQSQSAIDHSPNSDNSSSCE